MSRNGSGTYSLPAGNPVSTGSTISSSWANSTLSDIASALTGSIASDGQTTPTANLPMGTYAHTGVGNATARTMYASAGQVQDSTLTYLTSVSGTNAITASAPIVMTSYAAGQIFRFIAAGASTGAVTININSIGLKSIVRTDGSALVSGDIVSGAAVQIMYDGTNFQLLSDANGQSETVTNLTVTGTLTANNDATIHGVTVGKGAGSVSSNTVVGNGALASNTTGTRNTSVGYLAGQNLTTNSYNVLVGSYAGSQLTGALNTYVGDNAGGNTTNAGSNCVGVGQGALANNNASNNTAVGYNALIANTTGTPNDAFGYNALVNNTTGGSNVAVGYQSLTTNSTGSSNTALGNQAGYSISTANGNTLIGSGAGYSTTALTTGGQNVVIGNAAHTSTAGATNQIVIGASAAGKGDNTAFMGGSSGAYNGANSTLWAVTSDERIKQNVATIPASLDLINKLNPVEFDYKESGKHDIGFIAQEYQQVFPDQIISHDANEAEKEWVGDDQVLGIQQNLTPYLVKAIQELTAQVTALQAQVAALTPASGTPSA